MTTREEIEKIKTKAVDAALDFFEKIIFYEKYKNVTVDYLPDFSNNDIVIKISYDSVVCLLKREGGNVFLVRPFLGCDEVLLNTEQAERFCNILDFGFTCGANSFLVSIENRIKHMGDILK